MENCFVTLISKVAGTKLSWNIVMLLLSFFQITEKVQSWLYLETVQKISKFAGNLVNYINSQIYIKRTLSLNVLNIIALFHLVLLLSFAWLGNAFENSNHKKYQSDFF